MAEPPPARTERDLNVHAEGTVEQLGAPAESGAPSGWGPSGYRPHLDGLRAVAVYLVVLFHAGSDRFSGGYVGVDVFFVLSGFLVTQLLLRDLTGQGRIGFRRFYSRRFRRLLPAAFVTLIVTACVYTALASPVEVHNAVGAFRAAFVYVTNWYFIHQSTDYFAADITANPVLHFWSLAVEEQFYLLWPLLLGGLYVATRRLTARRWQTMRAVVAAGAVASVLWAWSLRTTNPSRAYYGTDARAYQLLAGALIALTPTVITRAARYRRVARITGVGALAALLVVASGWVHLDAIQRGAFVTVITVALLIVLETATGGLAQRALSTEPMTYLGQVSYGTYLWHWPVILVLTSTFHTATLTTVAITAVVATALASLSYHLLERPIRISPFLDRHRLPVIATGLAISLISAIVLIPAITQPATATAVAQPATGTPGDVSAVGPTPVPAGLDYVAAIHEGSDWGGCFGKAASACTLVHGTGKSIFLMGDSHAGMFVAAFKAIAEKNNLTFSTGIRGVCPWQRDLYVRPVRVFGSPFTPADCKAEKDDVYDRVIPALKPDIVVGINLDYEDPALEAVPLLGPDGQPLDLTSPGGLDWIAKTTTDSVAQLGADGRKAVIIEPIPVAPAGVNPLSCLSKARVVEECRYVATPGPDGVEQIYRELDRANDNVWSADFDRLVCPYLPICDPILDGQIVKFDGTHLTARFATAIAPAIETYLRQNGVL